MNNCVTAKKLESDRNCLTYHQWSTAAQHHETEIRTITVPYRARRMRAQKHPVHDFLFQYYSFSSTKLEQWHPGLGVSLEIPTEKIRSISSLKHPAYVRHRNVVRIGRPSRSGQFLRRLHWTIELLQTITERPPRFSCFGLHEWAMIDSASLERRHEKYSLRVNERTLQKVLCDLPLHCSHYDAFRFFTPENTTKNRKQLRSDDRLAHEQPGCIHATMDLYKWCFTFSPWVSSELLRACFFLALKAREIDMRASPYNLLDLGYEPICIESPEGRKQFQEEQRNLKDEAQPLRSRLLAELKSIRRATTMGESSHSGESDCQK